MLCACVSTTHCSSSQREEGLFECLNELPSGASADPWAVRNRAKFPEDFPYIRLLYFVAQYFLLINPVTFFFQVINLEKPGRIFST